MVTIFDEGSIRTPGVDLLMMLRYAEAGFPLRSPQDIFDVGARRGQEALQGVATGDQGPIVRSIRNRRQLDRLLDQIRSQAEAAGLQMWLRGQPRHYEMADVRDLAAKGICPIRGSSDASQVPSMYRGVNGGSMT